MNDFHDNSLPILPALNREMRCGVFTNGVGDVLIVHDQKIKTPIQWVEYDLSDGTICLIHEAGDIQDLGVEFVPKMKANLLKASNITLCYIDDKQIKSTQKFTFIINGKEF